MNEISEDYQMCSVQAGFELVVGVDVLPLVDSEFLGFCDVLLIGDFLLDLRLCEFFFVEGIFLPSTSLCFLVNLDPFVTSSITLLNSAS